MYNNNNNNNYYPSPTRSVWKDTDCSRRVS